MLTTIHAVTSVTFGGEGVCECGLGLGLYTGLNYLGLELNLVLGSNVLNDISTVIWRWS